MPPYYLSPWLGLIAIIAIIAAMERTGIGPWGFKGPPASKRHSSDQKAFTSTMILFWIPNHTYRIN